MLSNLLDTPLQVWRKLRVPNGSGGFTYTWSNTGTVYGRISFATGVTERALARTQVGDMQGAAEILYTVYVEFDAAIERGDELYDAETNQSFRIRGIIVPSLRDWYKAVHTELIQTEPTYLEES